MGHFQAQDRLYRPDLLRRLSENTTDRLGGPVYTYGISPSGTLDNRSAEDGNTPQVISPVRDRVGW